MKIKYIGTSIITLGGVGKLVPDQEFIVNDPITAKLIIGKPFFREVKEETIIDNKK